MTKLRIFFNWAITVFLGSLIGAIVADSNFHPDLFVIFLAVSVLLGLIPLILGLIIQHYYLDKDSDGKKLKIKLIISQVIAYLGIFTVLIVSNSGKSFNFDYLFFLIGLPYLIVGIILTLVSTN